MPPLFLKMSGTLWLVMTSAARRVRQCDARLCGSEKTAGTQPSAQLYALCVRECAGSEGEGGEVMTAWKSNPSLQQQPSSRFGAGGLSEKKSLG